MFPSINPYLNFLRSIEDVKIGFSKLVSYISESFIGANTIHLATGSINNVFQKEIIEFMIEPYIEDIKEAAPDNETAKKWIRTAGNYIINMRDSFYDIHKLEVIKEKLSIFLWNACRSGNDDDFLCGTGKNIQFYKSLSNQFYESLFTIAKIYVSMGDLEDTLKKNGEKMPSALMIKQTILNFFPSENNSNISHENKIDLSTISINKQKKPSNEQYFEVTIMAQCRIEDGTPGIVGEGFKNCSWDAQNKENIIIMTKVSTDEENGIVTWKATIKADKKSENHVQFKLVIWDEEKKQPRWQEDTGRYVDFGNFFYTDKNECFLRSDLGNGLTLYVASGGEVVKFQK